jgi:hypothetical protein
MSQKTFLWLLAVGMFVALAAASNAYGAQWYPFYGYHRPSYLSEPSTACVPAQPAAAEKTPENCTPAKTVGMQTSSPAVPCQSTARAQWYPFYGYNRPSYLDR